MKTLIRTLFITIATLTLFTSCEVLNLSETTNNDLYINCDEDYIADFDWSEYFTKDEISIINSTLEYTNCRTVNGVTYIYSDGSCSVNINESDMIAVCEEYNVPEDVMIFYIRKTMIHEYCHVLNYAINESSNHDESWIELYKPKLIQYYIDCHNGEYDETKLDKMLRYTFSNYENGKNTTALSIAIYNLWW